MMRMLATVVLAFGLAAFTSAANAQTCTYGISNITFSGVDVTVLVNATAVGASFASVMVSVKVLLVSSGVVPLMLASSTVTAT